MSNFVIDKSTKNYLIKHAGIYVCMYTCIHALLHAWMKACMNVNFRFKIHMTNTIFVSNHMYPENLKGTRVIVGSMNMGYVSGTARTRIRNLFRPKCAPIPLDHSDGQISIIWKDTWNGHQPSSDFLGCLLLLCSESSIGFHCTEKNTECENAAKNL